MIYLQLFISFLQIGLFSIGGGYAAMPLIQQQVVENHQWLSMTQFTDLITIAEMTPGPIAVNSATFVGIQIAGIPGAIVATLGCILPSLVIVLILAKLYIKYRNGHTLQTILGTMSPAIVALIGSAGLTILYLVLWGDAAHTLHNIRILGPILSAAALFILRKWKLNPILIMLLCGVIYTVISLCIG